jgi:hypothetical protein
MLLLFYKGRNTRGTIIKPIGDILDEVTSIDEKTDKKRALKIKSRPLLDFIIKNKRHFNVNNEYRIGLYRNDRFPGLLMEKHDEFTRDPAYDDKKAMSGWGKQDRYERKDRPYPAAYPRVALVNHWIRSGRELDLTPGIKTIINRSRTGYSGKDLKYHVFFDTFPVMWRMDDVNSIPFIVENKMEGDGDIPNIPGMIKKIFSGRGDGSLLPGDARPLLMHYARKLRHRYSLRASTHEKDRKNAVESVNDYIPLINNVQEKEIAHHLITTVSTSIKSRSMIDQPVVLTGTEKVGKDLALVMWNSPSTTMKRLVRDRFMLRIPGKDFDFNATENGENIPVTFTCDALESIIKISKTEQDKIKRKLKYRFKKECTVVPDGGNE